ncbi:MAG: peptide chain release factor N(5)-glutamine methyltransferase [Treponema sp.]|jgi:release factor glutamine methyltransferase|nr:peptide chain release factor N(5)-glutamine methyltransferase [Treponema sp.]
MTIRETLTEGSAVLKSADIENPALDASLLLAEVLGLSRASLMAAGQDMIPQERLVVFRRLIERRRNRECVAYILGRKEFRGLEFKVNPAVLVPRPDTETLVETAIMKIELFKNEAAPNAGPVQVFDLCTGSGAIAIALKNEMPELEVWASDISAGALETAVSNAVRLLPESSICFCQGDLFDALSSPPIPSGSAPVAAGGHPPLFSLIAANPPYIPSAKIKTLPPEVQKEPLPAIDGGGDGLDIIRNIITKAPDFLRAGASLLLEADPGEMQSIGSLLAEEGFFDIQTYKDLSGLERVIGGAKPEG